VGICYRAVFTAQVPIIKPAQKHKYNTQTVYIKNSTNTKITKDTKKKQNTTMWQQLQKKTLKLCTGTKL
jgi:hypothetical protein